MKLFSFFTKLFNFRCKRRLFKILNEIDTCSCIFGMPRSGKTSFCSYITFLALRSGVKVYSNVPIKGAIMKMISKGLEE